MKLDRLLAITMLLLNRKRVGAKELADRFEVSLRTIYRDLETINQAGIPIASFAGSSGGYEIMDSYRLDRQMLSLEELQSIIVALRGVRGTMEERDIGKLLDKVGALVAKSEHSSAETLGNELLIDINPWQRGEEDKEKLSVLRQAIRQSQLIQFAYTSAHGEDSERICEPMSVVLKGYVWYVYGYCRLRDDFRIFRLSRITRLQQLPEAFERREVSIEKLGYNMGQSMRGSAKDFPLIRLSLRFKSRAKARVQDYFARESIKMEEDGTLTVEAEQPDEPWLYGMLLGYGDDVTVLEPKHVAQELVRKAENIIRLYKQY
ncbi:MULTISPECIES: helix-turn-helix transcriptional regulator [unclassified Paenibacillus]|uniref:helix-turn-helix transcriptional regulator n=1 Tax=unclassified Paenibacillus TaxID=185978 RepID=UPI002F3E92E8